MMMRSARMLHRQALMQYRFTIAPGWHSQTN